MPVDLFLFAGQSNMAGRGAVCAAWPQEAPRAAEGAGWEYRAVSAPNRLWPLAEPFGAAENRTDGIDDRRGTEPTKTGSMVTAFINAYHAECGVPVVGVSASKGGSSMLQWQPGAPYLTDALARLQSARSFLTESGWSIRRTCCLWCQGETDGDLGTSAGEYAVLFDAMWASMRSAGIEALLMVQIGQCNLPGARDRYLPMMAWQNALAKTRENVYMVSRAFADMRERGLMKDAFHYYQQAYNEVGTEAGRNAARLLLV